MIITKEEAMESLPFIEDKNLWQAVDLALWLILVKDCSLKYSIDTASKKKSYSIKSHIEKHIKTAIPEEFFWERQSRNAPKNSSNKSNVAAQKIATMENQGKQHVESFTNKRNSS